MRNAVWRPPFVMYYLTFLIPEIRGTLEAAGYAVEERAGLFGGASDISVASPA